MGLSRRLITLRFDAEYRYGGNRPRVPVELVAPDGSVPVVFALLDTGAFTSVFQPSVAGLLGIDDIVKGEETPIRLPDGSDLLGYSHPAEIVVLAHRVRIRLTFCPSFAPTMDNVLGMRDFFEQIVVAFDHGHRRIYA